MKELQLNINKAFYVSVCLFAVCFIAITNVFGAALNLDLDYVELLVIAPLIVSSFVYLGLSLSGLRRVTFCSQGLFYIDVFGKKHYVLAEQIAQVQVISVVGIKATKITLQNSSLLFLAFNPCTKQTLRIKNFGYAIA